jgi:hypothetical protein
MERGKKNNHPQEFYLQFVVSGSVMERIVAIRKKGLRIREHVVRLLSVLCIQISFLLILVPQFLRNQKKATQATNKPALPINK